MKFLHLEYPWTVWSRDLGYSRCGLFDSSVLQLYCMSYAVRSAFLVTASVLVISAVYVDMWRLQLMVYSAFVTKWVPRKHRVPFWANNSLWSYVEAATRDGDIVQFTTDLLPILVLQDCVHCLLKYRELPPLLLILLMFAIQGLFVWIWTSHS